MLFYLVNIRLTERNDMTDILRQIAKLKRNLDYLHPDHSRKYFKKTPDMNAYILIMKNGIQIIYYCNNLFS